MKSNERVRYFKIPGGGHERQVFARGEWRFADLRWTIAAIEEAITEAVQAERERCAKVAESFAEDMRRQAKEIDADAGEGAGDNCLEHADAGDSIAAQIRAGEHHAN